MRENIELNVLNKNIALAGVYFFRDVNEEIIYIGSSKNLYKRMVEHRYYIKNGSDHGRKKDLYQFLKSNQFTVEIQLEENYRQLEQVLIEKYNPRFNQVKAYTGCGSWKGRKKEYYKERYQKYKEDYSQYRKEHREEMKEYNKKYRESHKEERKQYYESHKEEQKQKTKQYHNQLCLYNGERLTLITLYKRFWRKGLLNPAQEAKKYLIGGKKMKPNELFNYIRSVEYNNIGKDLDYKIEVDDDEKVIRVMFRESSSKLDWIYNFMFSIIPTFINKKPYWFSRGWRLSWNSGKEIILACIKNCRIIRPSYRIEVCGYSFGGAIAQICGIEIYENFGVKSELITFGSPSPLFGIITKLMAKRCFNSVQQYAHKSDIVTWAPPFPFYFSIKNKRIGKFSFKNLFNPIVYHQIYNDERLY